MTETRAGKDRKKEKRGENSKYKPARHASPPLSLFPSLLLFPSIFHCPSLFLLTPSSHSLSPIHLSFSLSCVSSFLRSPARGDLCNTFPRTDGVVGGGVSGRNLPEQSAASRCQLIVSALRRRGACQRYLSGNKYLHLASPASPQLASSRERAAKSWNTTTHQEQGARERREGERCMCVCVCEKKREMSVRKRETDRGEREMCVCI